MCRLREPEPRFEAAYRSFVEQFKRHEKNVSFLWQPEEQSFTEFLEELCDRAQGRNLPEGFVPARKFWYVTDVGMILGELDLRDRLTPALEDYGGHIGYRICPGQRGKGHGTRMLALALDEARNLGLARVLVTCDPENRASVRVIERNGGRLTSRSVAYTGRMTSRYWIDLWGSVKFEV